LTPARGYRFLGAFVSTDAAMARMAIDRPQILLLDVDLPGSDAFALLSRLTRDFPATRVVMLSGHVRREYIERALDGGAAGYIVKDEGIPVIMELIKRSLAGEVVLSPTAKRSLIGAPC
jgi:DNA-binding NarL/FixJ family response regulator